MARRVRIVIAHGWSLFSDALGFVPGKFEDLLVVADAGKHHHALGDGTPASSGGEASSSSGRIS